MCGVSKSRANTKVKGLLLMPMDGSLHEMLVARFEGFLFIEEEQMMS